MLPTTEDAKTEFKQSFTDEVIIALVAFANMCLLSNNVIMM